MPSAITTAQTTHLLRIALQPPPDNVTNATKIAHMRELEELFDYLEARRESAENMKNVNRIRLSNIERDINILMNEWTRLLRRWNVVVDEGVAVEIGPENLYSGVECGEMADDREDIEPRDGRTVRSRPLVEFS
ncbi:hypothetical protein EJ05DRAFT_502669 [Pseudovirgaria hyperparasitica]|uniref:Uncharacterized protein n=1 Tax=Pseudovirgaria hyperparasitica TaxID=470096 RepID=A0A6A6VZV9_9PEZI|nr:uncharacterized protein EJ05DRAFT_502669 [Pseudovirgaria hyperparasitica]KAF2756208.1 hypothetical protein EJ05DRAFT_502669 [Pseudovirgaria hyperparasitica]